MTLFIDCNNYLQSETLLKPRDCTTSDETCYIRSASCAIFAMSADHCMLALLGLLIGFFCYNCLFLPFFSIVFQTLLPWWTSYTALFVYGKYYLIKNRNMAQIQGGHCPWSKIQGGQPTTLTPPCRAPASRRQYSPSSI